MKARVWLRIAAALQALGTVGHTLNTASGAATHGSQEQAVFDAMQTFHFEVMGATRTVWDFYRGYEFSITSASFKFRNWKFFARDGTPGSTLASFQIKSNPPSVSRL